MLVFFKTQWGIAAMIVAGFHRAPLNKPYEFEVSYLLTAALIVRGIKDADTLLAFLSSAGLSGPSPSPADRGTSPAEASTLILELPHDNAGPVRLHFQDHAFHLAIEALTVGV